MKLKKVTLSNSVFSIEDEAFAKCSRLKTISFGTATTVLGKKVLYQDKRLTKITFKSDQIQAIGKKTFRGVPKSVAIYVPTLSAKQYKKLIKKAK